jgi:hypothetical protein
MLACGLSRPPLISRTLDHLPGIAENVRGCHMRAGFAYMWEFRVDHNFVDKFMALYWPSGEWIRLFRRGQGYSHTELHCDVSDQFRFVTVDYWASEDHCRRFRSQYAAQIEEVDQLGERLTEAERMLGEYTFTSS